MIDDLADIGFDNYSDAVREADASFILSGPNVSAWGVAQCLLNRIVLQFGNAGGATIAFGVSRPDATVLVAQTNALQEGAIFNGQVVGPNDFAVLPGGSHYTFANAPSKWLSISVPLDLQEVLPANVAKALFPETPALVSLNPDASAALRSAAIERGKMTLDPNHPLDDSESTILQALTTAMVGVSPHKRRTAIIRGEETIAKSLEFVQGEADNAIRIENICRAIEVNERNLRRNFNEYFGMSPHHYLKLRQLNIVRRAIRAGNTENITNILTLNGVTEFGRFAGEYRTLFGEAPSDTARRNLS